MNEQHHQQKLTIAHAIYQETISLRKKLEAVLETASDPSSADGEGQLLADRLITVMENMVMAQDIQIEMLEAQAEQLATIFDRVSKR